MTRCTITFTNRSSVTYEAEWTSGGRKERISYAYDLPQEALLLQTVQWLAHLLAASPRDAQQWHFLKVIGQNLFELIFPGDSQKAVAARNNFVMWAQRGRLSVDLYFEHDAGLWAGLPWEFLYVPDDGGAPGFFLADPAKEVSLYRRLRPPEPARASAPPPLKVLVAVSNPPGPRPVVQRQPLQDYLDDLSRACLGKIRCEFLPEDADHDTLHARISAFQPDIFHFRGHGERGGLWLTAPPDAVAAERERIREAHARGDFSPDTFNAGVLLPKESVAQLFDSHRPRLLILEACHSGSLSVVPSESSPSVESLSVPRIAERLMTQVPAVVAMQYTIHVDTASSFVEELYKGIAEGKDVDEAVSRARAQLTRARNNGLAFADRSFGAPVVYLGSQGPLCERLLGSILLRCPSCGTDCADKPPNFCTECGTLLHLACRKCGKKTAVSDPLHPPLTCWGCGDQLPPVPGRAGTGSAFGVAAPSQPTARSS